MADSARHHGIARGSAMECAAVLDGMRVLRLISHTQHAAGIELLARIVSMLRKLCRPSLAPGRAE